jgi:hypothetical protein
VSVINSEPRFANQGTWSGNTYITGDYQLESNSPCIDSGTSQGAPNTDIKDVQRPQGVAFDIGAYEYTSSSSGVPGTDPGPNGDPTFTLVWGWSDSAMSEGPDIDIWVEDPLGQLLATSRDGFGLGPTPQGGEIDYDDLGGWGSGDGGGPERCFWPNSQAPNGTFTFGVRYFQGDGTADYTLRIYKNSSLLSTYVGTVNTPGTYVTLGSINYP